MRILLNATSCVVGGGVQVAAGFVNHLWAHHRERLSDWTFALSTQVSEECAPGFVCELRSQGRLVIATASPGSLFRGLSTRAMLRRLCRSSRCERVFTVFGPSYVDFPVPEVMGFADAFAFNATREAYTWHPPLERFIGRIRKNLKIRQSRKAHRYWVEAASAKKALALAVGVDEDKVTVIPNCVNRKVLAEIRPRHQSETPTFFYLAAAYWHKNHMILPHVLRKLREARPNLRLLVLTTLPPDSAQWRALEAGLARVGAGDMVRNLGSLSLAQVAGQLSTCTAVMQCSLLETFSSTYIEAMAAGVPLLAADRSYARDICGDAALYADPLNPESISRQMLRLLEDACLRDSLVSKGHQLIAKLPDSFAKNEKLLEFCTQ